MATISQYVDRDDESHRFHRVAAPTHAELQRLLRAIATRVTRALEGQGAAAARWGGKHCKTSNHRVIRTDEAGLRSDTCVDRDTIGGDSGLFQCRWGCSALLLITWLLSGYQ